MTRYRDYAIASTNHRPRLQRALVALLVVTGVTLLVLAKSQHPAATSARLTMLSLLRPTLSAMSQPITSIRGLMSDTRALMHTFEENKQLRAENDSLRHWRSVAMAMKAENASLRTLMSYQPVRETAYVTARVIGTSPASFSQLLTINAGTQEGIASLQPVVDAHGLIGRVLETDQHVSQVLLLNDVTSRVPVVTGSTRQRAILSGTGGELLRLSFVGADAPITLGEEVVTTEEGSLIPGGIMIGTVFKRDQSGFLVKPVRDLNSAEYLRVIASSDAARPASEPVTLPR